MFGIFRKSQEREEKSSFFKSNANWITPSTSILEETYYNNPIVFRCVNLFTEYVNRIKITSDNESLSKYLKNNIKHITYNLLVYGNCFLHKDLYILNIHEIKILSHEITNDIIGYRYKHKIYDLSDILHLKYGFNIHKMYGISPIQVAIKSINLYNNIYEYLVALVQSGGRTSGILSHEEILTEQEKNKLKQDFKEIHTNFGQNVSLLMTGGSFKWQAIGCEPEKLELHLRLDETMRDIATIFGIPTMLLGVIKDNMTFSNFQTAREHMWEDVILPFTFNIINTISDFFISPIFCSYQNIEAIDKQLWKLEGILTINERRKLLGFDDILNGDKI